MGVSALEEFSVDYNVVSFVNVGSREEGSIGFVTSPLPDTLPSEHGTIALHARNLQLKLDNHLTFPTGMPAPTGMPPFPPVLSGMEIHEELHINGATGQASFHIASPILNLCFQLDHLPPVAQMEHNMIDSQLQQAEQMGPVVMQHEGRSQSVDGEPCIGLLERAPVSGRAADQADQAWCAVQCQAQGYCCNDPSTGSDQMISCAQACMMRASGESMASMLVANGGICDRQSSSGCSLTVMGQGYSFCQSCNDLQPQCPSGVQSSAECDFGASLVPPPPAPDRSSGSGATGILFTETTTHPKFIAFPFGDTPGGHRLRPPVRQVLDSIALKFDNYASSVGNQFGVRACEVESQVSTQNLLATNPDAREFVSNRIAQHQRRLQALLEPVGLNTRFNFIPLEIADLMVPLAQPCTNEELAQMPGTTFSTLQAAAFSVCSFVMAAVVTSAAMRRKTVTPADVPLLQEGTA